MPDFKKYDAYDRESDKINVVLGLGKVVYQRLQEHERATRYHNGGTDPLAIADFFESLTPAEYDAVQRYNAYLLSAAEPNEDSEVTPSDDPTTGCEVEQPELDPRLDAFLERQQYGGVSKSGLTVSDVVKRWIDYKVNKQKGAWKPKSLKRNKPVIEKLVLLLDDPEARTVSPEMLRDKFIGQRYFLPQGLKRKKIIHLGKTEETDMNGNVVLNNDGSPVQIPIYKPSHEIIELCNQNNWSIDSEDTIGRENGTIKNFLDWAEGQNYMQAGLDKVMKDYTQYSRKSNRTIFTAEDLKLLFESDHYQQGKLKSEPHKHWIPLICLTTGARSGEAAQLRVTDIDQVEVEGAEPILVFKFIADEDTNQTSKSEGSRRVTPIPDVLLARGLLNFVEQVRARGDEYLFPETIPTSVDGDWSDAISSWFHGGKRQIGFMELCGVEKRVKIEGKWKVRVFHSFRHTWVNTAKNARVDKEMRCEISGHSEGEAKDAHDGYSHHYNIALRKQAIEQVKFDLEWSAIPKWR